METTHLDEFRRVAELGSFTLAARELHMTQSALSKHVAALEREFSVDLFTRDKNGISLTPEGQILYQQSVSLARFLSNLRGMLTMETGLEGIEDVGALLPGQGASALAETRERRSDQEQSPDTAAVRTERSAYIPSAAIRKRCHEMRTEYNFTTDETCTLILFLEDAGFDTIQHELGISRDEVADTLVAVYRKLGVTNKSEALKLVLGA